MKGKRRVLSLMVVFAIVLSMFTVAFSSFQAAEVPANEVGVRIKIGIYGDTDSDEKITVKDATKIQKYLAKILKLEADQQKLADFRVEPGTGVQNPVFRPGINVKCATWIQKYVAKFKLAGTEGVMLGEELWEGEDVTVPPTRPTTSPTQVVTKGTAATTPTSTKATTPTQSTTKQPTKPSDATTAPSKSTVPSTEPKESTTAKEPNRTIYLDVKDHSSWQAADAKTYAYFSASASGKDSVWLVMTPVKGNNKLYSVTYPESYQYVNFTRMRPDNVDPPRDYWQDDDPSYTIWNKTDGLLIPSDQDTFYLYDGYPKGGMADGEWIKTGGTSSSPSTAVSTKATTASTKSTESTEASTASTAAEPNRTIYLDVSRHSSWQAANAKTYAYFSASDSGKDNVWLEMTLVDGNSKLYSVTYPKSYQYVNFTRMRPDNVDPSRDYWKDDNPSYTIWNQTDGLSIPKDQDTFYLYDGYPKNGKADGEWIISVPTTNATTNPAGSTATGPTTAATVPATTTATGPTTATTVPATTTATGPTTATTVPATTTAAEPNRTIYLDVKDHSSWQAANAKTYAYFSASALGKDNFWIEMTPVDGNSKLYSVTYPESYKYVNFTRMRPDNVDPPRDYWQDGDPSYTIWNKTNGLLIPKDEDTFYLYDGYPNGGMADGKWIINIPTTATATSPTTATTTAPATTTATGPTTATTVPATTTATVPTTTTATGPTTATTVPATTTATGPTTATTVPATTTATGPTTATTVPATTTATGPTTATTVPATTTAADLNRTIYLDVSRHSSWQAADAKTYAYFSASALGKDSFWIEMTLVGGNDKLYSVTYPESYQYVNFTRMRPDNVDPPRDYWKDDNPNYTIWNKTDGLAIPKDEDTFRLYDGYPNGGMANGEWIINIPTTNATTNPTGSTTATTTAPTTATTTTSPTTTATTTVPTTTTATEPTTTATEPTTSPEPETRTIYLDTNGHSWWNNGYPDITAHYAWFFNETLGSGEWVAGVEVDDGIFSFNVPEDYTEYVLFARINKSKVGEENYWDGYPDYNGGDKIIYNTSEDLPTDSTLEDKLLEGKNTFVINTGDWETYTESADPVEIARWDPPAVASASPHPLTIPASFSLLQSAVLSRSSNGTNTGSSIQASQSGGILRYAASLPTTETLRAFYWDITLSAGNFSNVTLDVTLGGTTASTNEYFIQYSYNGAAFQNISDDVDYPKCPIGNVANTQKNFLKNIPNGNGILVIRIYQNSLTRISSTTAGVAGDNLLYKASVKANYSSN